MTQLETSPAGPTRKSPIQIRKLGHVVIQVRDFERSMKFYTEVMNFRVSDRLPDGSVFLTSVGDHHTVALFPALDGPDAAPPPAGGVRLHHFAMEVGSLEELFEIRSYLQEQGVPIVWEGRRRLGGHTSVEFLDPDGYHLELYYDMDQIGPNGERDVRDTESLLNSLEAARDNPK